MRKLWLYLYSGRNIVASSLCLIGLGLFFAGFIKAFWPLIVGGLYVAGYLVTPRPPQFDFQLSQELDLKALEESLEELATKIKQRVSPEVLSKVESVKSMIIDLIPRLSDLRSCDEQVFIVRQMALSYLPETLENYLNLPKAYARFHPVREGKTSREILIDQLGLLENEIMQITENLNRNDTQKMLAHGQFLEERFQKPELF